MFTDELIDHLFSYHAPTPDQQLQYIAIRESAKEFCKVMVANTPTGPGQSAAVRKLRECVQTANASIACNGQ